MSKIFLKRCTKQNIKDIRNELARAHLIITLLSIALISLLSIIVAQSMTVNVILSAICVVLLSIVALVSLCMSLALFTCKK
jgi:predicted lysophospholipase L1 biosynthesis ABC-type transport system permease subunit